MTVARSDQVSNDSLRAAFLREEKAGRVDAKLVAIRMGWVNRGTPDVTRVRRNLGLAYETKGGKRYYWSAVEQTRAAQLCEAIGLDPHEVDL